MCKLLALMAMSLFVTSMADKPVKGAPPFKYTESSPSDAYCQCFNDLAKKTFKVEEDICTVGKPFILSGHFSPPIVSKPIKDLPAKEAFRCHFNKGPEN